MRRTNNCLYVGKDIKLEYKSLNRFCLFINELKFLLKGIVDEFFEWQSCKKFHKWFLTKICSKEEQNCTILAEFNCKGAQITNCSQNDKFLFKGAQNRSYKARKSNEACSKGLQMILNFVQRGCEWAIETHSVHKHKIQTNPEPYPASMLEQVPGSLEFCMYISNSSPPHSPIHPVFCLLKNYIYVVQTQTTHTNVYRLDTRV